MLWALKYLYALQLTLFLLCGCAENKAEELVVAASDGDLSTVRRLLDQGVNVESRALDGLTPLKAAARKGRLDVVQLLTARGASINAGPNDDDTPLAVAAIYNHTDVAAFLIAHGGKLRGTPASNEDLLQSLKAKHNQPLYVLIRDELQTERADSIH
jgi:ankyrin repeat protein